ncbi:class I heat shock protein 3 [Sesamum alatum]|uniref:Class I heat shock protein 3 n=1 Tax=Sesamum alatum TaxID=300844 RepID=A0AAE1YU83_9LAMI|nr:class I heat shock protein 3 [Sesamum alatum]
MLLKNQFLSVPIDLETNFLKPRMTGQMKSRLKKEVKVEVEEGNVLQISGERTREKEEKNDTWHRVERSSGKFLRRFRLPENAKMDQIKASMENGVLTVTVPKEEVKKPEVKAIQISG